MTLPVRDLTMDLPMTEKTLDAAVRKVAPLWPLRHFVAVNPYLGLVDQPFDRVAQRLGQVAGARLTLPRADYAGAIAEGAVTDADLAEALAAAQAEGALAHLDSAALAAKAREDRTSAADPTPLPTVADTARGLTGDDWGRFITERISHWAAARFDEAQASWRSPWRNDPPYAAWREEASRDRTPEIMGLHGLRHFIRSLPDNPDEAAARALQDLGMDRQGTEIYLHRLLMDIAGWAGFARYLLWERELRGETDDTLHQMLVIRLVWDQAILKTLGNTDLAPAWQDARRAFTDAETAPPGTDLAIDLTLQSARERAWQRRLIDTLAAPRPETTAERKAAQVAFCIDVRSEVFRRALEAVTPDIETIGFAGFFGFSIEYVPLGQTHGGAQCPVLLTPSFTICESVQGTKEEEETELLGLRLLRRRTEKAWKSFKLAAISSFGFVETMGLTFLAKLATDTLGLTRPVTHPGTDGVDGDVIARLGPRIEAREVAGRRTGMDEAKRLDTAETVLRAMSLTENFARLVILAGHGSTTVNNPHATGLDCGACGGHTGEANARVAAAILNDPEVRAGLWDRGIEIPTDTIFLGALHDTTTDEVRIFDDNFVPTTHRADIDALKTHLAAAGAGARAERALCLDLEAGRNTDAAVIARSHDWSQVRPEWGLAGCAGFIAAPRHRTAGRDLGGRCFLHSYEWRKDTSFAVLELIMTAPMVVASWISLQYYGSAVDNRVFGCGNKTLHNVSGTIGVLEGNGGDLRVGLPWQSVHDGETLVHEPLRLSVVIEAPTEAMDTIIAKHDNVRQLLDNGWLTLFAMGDAGTIEARYDSKGGWTPVAEAA